MLKDSHEMEAPKAFHGSDVCQVPGETLSLLIFFSHFFFFTVFAIKM